MGREKLPSITDDELQIILARSYAWEYCVYMNPDFFLERQDFLQPVIDVYQYLIQWERKEKIPVGLIERIKSNKYVEKFNENPEIAGASLPPRAGKSYGISMACTWGLGKYPTESIMRVSHGQSLYNKLSRDVRNIINSEKFCDVFPGIYLDRENAAVTGWSLEKSEQGVSYFGAGVDGAIIGLGATLVAITDDLYKSHNEAMSPTIIERTDIFMDSAFDSRLEDIVKQYDVGTRWTTKDYMGVKHDAGDYDIFIKVPALDENDNSFCEKVKTTKKYRKIRDRFYRKGKEEFWLSEYMQNPVEFKGILFRKSELKRFRKADLNMDNLIGKVCFVDTADKGNDYYSAPVGYIFSNPDNIYDVFITDVIFTRKEFKYTQPKQVAFIKKHGIDWTYIETNKEGTLYVNNIRNLVKPYKVNGLRQPSNVMKITRILFEAGYIYDFYFLEDDEQDDAYKEYFVNLTDFVKEGKNDNDDAPDSTAGLSKGIRAIFKKLVKLKYKDEQNNDNDDTYTEETD